MEMEAAMTLQPRLHVGVLVSAVVVHDQVQRDLTGKLAIQATQELQELLMSMATVALTDHFALQDFKRSKQARRAIALVVMRHRAESSLLQGQSRLRAIERLNLGLLVYTQHDRLLRRIQIQPHHVTELLHEARIARELEILHAMRLQVMAAPDVADHGLANTLCLRHIAATPLRLATRLGVQSGLNDRLDLLRPVER